VRLLNVKKKSCCVLFFVPLFDAFFI